MNQPEADLSATLSDLAEAMLRPITRGDALAHIARVCESLRHRPIGQRIAAAADLAGRVRKADPILVESVLAAITGDLRHFEAVLDIVDRHRTTFPLDALNQLHWCITRQFFLRRMDAATRPRFVEERLYPAYRAMIGEIVRRLDLHPPRRAANAPVSGRVALVTNQFLSTRHQPSRDLLHYARILEERCGRKVTIFNTNMMPLAITTLFVPSYLASIEPAFDGRQMMEADGRAYRMLSSTCRSLTAGAFRPFFIALEREDPDVVVSLGGSMILGDVLAGSRPTLTIPTTSGFILSLADIVLDYGGGAPPDDGPLATSWRPFRFSFSLHRDASGNAGARAAFGLDEDAIVAVVVGNRLDDEVDAAFLDVLEAILDRDPRIVVVFAGSVAHLPARLNTSRHAARLRSLGYIVNIAALLASCDLFLNPRRAGGGGGAAQAMAAGAVPVTFDDGDVARCAGPAFCVADDDAFIARVIALATDPTLLTEMSHRVRRQQHEFGDVDTTARDLARYLDEAQTVFATRRDVTL